MSIQERRERERTERERLIVMAAMELAESEGWDAVTTRRLAAEIEYSQPVLYSHFKGKDAIMAAVAVEGFADLAVKLRAARTSAAGPRQALAEVSAVYAAFAEQRPALYDAMFTTPSTCRSPPPKHRPPCARPSPNYVRPCAHSPETTTWRRSPRPSGVGCTGCSP